MRKITFLLFFIISLLRTNAFYYNGLYFYPSYDGCECRGFDPNYIIPSNCTVNIPSVAVYTSNNQSVSLPVTSIAHDAFKGYTQIDHVVIPSSIERIGDRAFSSCINLTELILYPSTKEIGDDAFFGCISLVGVNTSAETIGAEAFCGCISLSEVNLGAGVKYIYAGAFKGCTSLTNIDIPFTTQQIGGGVVAVKYGGAFEDCLNLLAVTFSYNLTDKLPTLSRIEHSTFKNCINLPRLDFPYSLTYIGSDAFLRCTSLKHIEWGGPNKLTIGSTDFTGVPLSRMVCHGDISMHYNDLQKLSNLTEVRYDTYATEVAGYQFQNMTKLTTVHLDKVTKINISAFEGCTGLKNLTLSRELEEIGHAAFKNCIALEKLEVPQNVKSIDTYAFNGCKNISEIKLCEGLEKINASAFKGCHRVKELTIPMSVNSFTINAIDSCSNLKSMTLGGPIPLYLTGNLINVPLESLTLRGNIIGQCLRGNESIRNVKFTDYCTEISLSAFSGCKNLTNPDFSNIKKIYNSAFRECTSLTSIDLSNVENIDYDAFYGCGNLQEVKFGKNIEEIPSGILNYTGIISLIVPNTVTKFYAPSYCENLTEVTLGDGINDIGGNFYGCNKLRYLRLGANTTSVYVSPSSLEKIVSANPIPPRTSQFNRMVYEQAELVVPIGASEVYKDAIYWRNFSKIKEEDLSGVEGVSFGDSIDKLYVGDGFIEIDSRSPVVIYGLDGRPVKDIITGNRIINLPKGIYVICNGSMKRKVVI